MKNLLILIFFVAVVQVNGQEMPEATKVIQAIPMAEDNLVSVDEEVRFMSQGENNAYKVVIERTSLKMVNNIWDKYVKRFKGKTKEDKKTKEVKSDDCKIPEMSSNTVDMYVRFGESAGNTVTTHVWFDLGGAYLNSTGNPEKSQIAQNMLGEFARLVYKEEAIEVVNMEEKKLKDLNQDLKRLEKDKDGYLKKIEDAKEEIAKMKANIDLNAQNQGSKKSDISDQEVQVNQAKAVVQSYN